LQAPFLLSRFYHNRNLLKVIAEDESHEPNISLIGRLAIVDDVSIDLDGLKAVFQGLVQDLKAAEREVTRGLCDSDPRFKLTLPDLFLDQPDKHDVDFWFGCLPANGLLDFQEVMIDALINHPVFHNACFLKARPGDLRVNPAVGHSWLQACERLRGILLAAMVMFSGSPARGTEIISQAYRNTPCGTVRNVQVINGRLCFVGGYNKTDWQVSSPPTSPVSTCADGFPDPAAENDLPLSSPGARLPPGVGVVSPQSASPRGPGAWLG